MPHVTVGRYLDDRDGRQMTTTEPPLLHPFPAGTPTDAELAAQRDADHAREIAEWEARGKCLCGPTVRLWDGAAWILGQCLCGATC